jgi:antitoxin component YwqK of YwqJK toxin-antitoxin module
MFITNKVIETYFKGTKNIMSRTTILNNKIRDSHYYNRKGQLTLMCSYKDNLRNGICMEWNHEGELLYIGIWNNDKPVNYFGDNRFYK